MHTGTSWEIVLLWTELWSQGPSPNILCPTLFGYEHGFKPPQALILTPVKVILRSLCCVRIIYHLPCQQLKTQQMGTAVNMNGAEGEGGHTR